jgi:hypothetical protein
MADLLVFGPLGFALEARRIWPALVDRGRGQVNLARATGRRAVARYHDSLGHRVEDVRDETASALRGLGLVSPPRADDAPEDVEDEPPTLRAVGETGESRSGAPEEGRSASPEDPAVDVTELAIPGYDSLSASQVVPRLAGLEDAELELVRRYELQHRGRKTILNKIAQLQSR